MRGKELWGVNAKKVAWPTPVANFYLLVEESEPHGQDDGKQQQHGHDSRAEGVRLVHEEGLARVGNLTQRQGGTYQIKWWCLSLIAYRLVSSVSRVP